MEMKRTVCDCKDCQKCCHIQPGHLLPGEMEKIAEHLEQPLEEVKAKFWASPGAVVMDTESQLQFRVGTITPRYDRRKKACVFLTDDNRCSIHAVAPFGCAMFDTHMTMEKGQPLSAWGLVQIINSKEYKALRESLPFADHWKPRGY